MMCCQPNATGVRRRRENIQRHGEGGHVRTEAQVSDFLATGQELQGLLASMRGQERGMEQILSQHLQKKSTPPTFWL